MDGTHTGWSVSTFWTHQNCQWGVLRGQKCPKNTMNQANLATSGIGWSKWLNLSESWILLDLCGTHPGWSVGTIWAHQNCHWGAWGVQHGTKCHKPGRKRLHRFNVHMYIKHGYYANKWIKTLTPAQNRSSNILLHLKWGRPRLLCLITNTKEHSRTICYTPSRVLEKTI